MRFGTRFLVVDWRMEYLHAESSPRWELVRLLCPCGMQEVWRAVGWSFIAIAIVITRGSCSMNGYERL